MSNEPTEYRIDTLLAESESILADNRLNTPLRSEASLVRVLAGIGDLVGLDECLKRMRRMAQRNQV